MTALLEAEGVGACRDGCAPTDLRLEAPELVCLVGPNGSGKTSLLHALARIGGPAGEVRIDGLRPKTWLRPRGAGSSPTCPPRATSPGRSPRATSSALGAGEAEADEAMAALDLTALGRTAGSTGSRPASAAGC